MTESSPGFDEICREAAEAFLQTVVVVDNEASLSSARSQIVARKVSAPKRRPSAPGKSAAEELTASNRDEATSEDLPERGEEDLRAHRLELNAVSQAFAQHHLTCGVYLPNDGDEKSIKELVSETTSAIRPTDACVLDWQLRLGDPKPTIEAIKKVLEADQSEGGRLRLILIYTAEELDRAANELKSALDEKELDVDLYQDNGVPVISGVHFRIAFANKPTLGRDPDNDPATVSWEELPERILEEFRVLSSGLLRAFALSSVAAVRRDMHRILAQFEEGLDPVYAGDRATKPDPDDAGGLMVEILQSELELSIRASDAADICLGPEACVAWLKYRGDQCTDQARPINFYDKTRNSFTEINDKARRELLRLGTRDIKTREFQKSVTQSFFSSEELQEDGWEKKSAQYAVLSTFAYHSGETATRTVPHPPVLKFGTVVGDEEGVFLCIQPACDTVRLTQKTAFIFVALIPNDSEFDLVLPAGGSYAHYQLPEKQKDKHLREVRTLWFEPQNGDDIILAGETDKKDFRFKDADEGEWIWRAQLREMTAVHLAQKAVRSIGRIGANEFEWLRTSAK